VLALSLWAALCLGTTLLPRAKAAPRAHTGAVSVAAVAQPRVIPRSGWGADEELRFDWAGRETWLRTFWPVQKIIIHHTETQNNDPDPAGTIRKLYRDAVRLQGLGDIPYNFLIDEEGRIYEGRYSRQYGPAESPTGEDQFANGVMAAHSYGHNPGTVGVALLGSLGDLEATPRARTALEQLVTWIAARHHIDPSGSSVYRNPATGNQSTFPNVAGHRDVNDTECPGRTFYTTLPGIRADVAALMAGKTVPAQPNTRRGTGKRPRTGRNRQRRREGRAIDRVLRRHPVVFSGGGRRREVALTFHDGPGPNTTQVVKVLRRMRATATFFDIGDSLIYFSDSAVEADRRGFPIGNLTESFSDLAILPTNEQRRAIRGQAARLRSLGIPSPRLFSPPYGSYNRKTLSVLRRLHLLTVLWSVNTRDYLTPGVRTIVRRAVRGARPGSIILLHDAGGDRTQTIAALPAVVRGLRSRGFELVTVPRLMLDDPPRR
jgi:peptidoglycan/xylan/chitin deacetylase (PgdA/CDA1 family)